MKVKSQLGDTMLEAKSKIINRPKISKGTTYNALFIYLPTDITKDSQFPFSPDDVVNIKIKGKSLIIEKSLSA
jgi:hypothetical protein